MAIQVHIIQGKALYAKIGGDPVPGYEPAQLEWTTDLVLDDENLDKFLQSGAGKQYVKETKTGAPFVKFTRKEIKKDGSKGKPIEVVDENNKPWEYGKKIGNDSILNVKYTLNEVGKGKDLRLKPSVLGVQVWTHIPYESGAGFQVKGETPAGKAW